MAKLQVQFTKVKQQAKAVPKYDDKSIWRCPKKLSETLKEILKKGGLQSHGKWKQANEILVQEQETRDKVLCKEYIGPVSKELILRRKQAMEEDDEALANELKKEIRKTLRKDRRKWEYELTSDNLNSKEQWKGLKT